MESISFEQYQNTKHFPMLDGIRGISILLVITVHLYYSNFSWAWLSGKSGVQIFFVLSGFLITMLALREENRNGYLNIKSFYIRRAFRIFPLYFLVLGIYCAIIFALGVGGAYDQSRLKSALPFYLLYVNEFAPGAPFYQSWSLGIEEKFYLMWPFLAFVLLRKNHYRRAFVTGFMIILFLALHQVFPQIKLIHYHSILIGCLLAIAMEDRNTFERLHILGSGYWPVVLLFMFVCNHLALAHFPKLGVLYPFGVGLWLVSAITSQPAWLSWRPLTFIGERSYGIYLVHILCVRAVKFAFPASTNLWWVSLLGFVTGTALSIIIAEILFRFFEHPCILLGRRYVQKVDPVITHSCPALATEQIK